MHLCMYMCTHILYIHLIHETYWWPYNCDVCSVYSVCITRPEQSYRNFTVIIFLHNWWWVVGKGGGEKREVKGGRGRREGGKGMIFFNRVRSW